MSLVLTPALLHSTYSMLDECQPFCKWNLPDAEDITFEVNRSKRNCGVYTLIAGKAHKIGISVHFHGRVHNLIETMAHEMIHLHVWRHPGTSRGGEHNAAWRRYANEVCKELGFDRSMFGG